MEKHRFVLPYKNDMTHILITETQLNGLLAGLDFNLMKEFSEINYDKIF